MVMFKSLDEMPQFVISRDTSEHNRTGSWRYLRPVYTEKLPPCQSACPAGNNIAVAMRRIREGEFKKAWEALTETTPFPYVCGKVCPHPCENSCNRATLDEAISIRQIEEFLGQEAIDNEWLFPAAVAKKSGKVAAIGSGPSGLSCAYQLARMGYPVTIFESSDKAGGLLRWAIPEYRLPREILDREINRIQELGVRIELNSPVEDLAAVRRQGYKAIYLAIGAGLHRELNIPGEHADGVLNAMDFLRKASSGIKVISGGRVVVIGGGNAAVDAARVSRRMGAGSVMILYRRSRSEMPAFKTEVEEAEKEGVNIHFLITPQEILTTDEGLVRGLKCVRMELGRPDADGRRSPMPVSGTEVEIDADQVIVAIGQSVDRSMQHEKIEYSSRGTITVDPELLQTNIRGVFAGGDSVTGPSTVVGAIGAGCKAAFSIDNYLNGGPPLQDDKPTTIVDIKELNLNYFAHTVRRHTIAGRASVKAEADRCLSCGVCRGCDNCLIFCPDIAVYRYKGSYAINYDYCKGCGICSQECPCNFISMIEEER